MKGSNKMRDGMNPNKNRCDDSFDWQTLMMGSTATVDRMMNDGCKRNSHLISTLKHVTETQDSPYRI